VLDASVPTWVDADGLHEGIPDNLMSRAPVDTWSPALVMVSAEEVVETFTDTGVASEQVIQAQHDAHTLGLIDLIRTRQVTMAPTVSPSPTVRRPRRR